MAAGDGSSRLCVSSDGKPIGIIAGIHRDINTNVATWAVLDSGRNDHRFVVVPLSGAQPAAAGMAFPFTAAQVAGAPRVADPTRMLREEEQQLAVYYGSVGKPVAAPLPTRGSAVPSMIRSEETISVSSLEWRPYKRARVRRVVRTEDVQYVVSVRREELVIEEEPITAVERLEVAFQVVDEPKNDDLDLVLHREEVVLQKRVVPYEHVHVSVAPVVADWTIKTTLAKERVDVERRRLRR